MTCHYSQHIKAVLVCWWRVIAAVLELSLWALLSGQRSDRIILKKIQSAPDASKSKLNPNCWCLGMSFEISVIWDGEAEMTKSVSGVSLFELSSIGCR